jgi:GcrA cell cycle regulator
MATIEPTIEAHATWTTERVALLKNGIAAGLSCAQIAREIGVSRNAVIGKANRLGLSRVKSATAAVLRDARYAGSSGRGRTQRAGVPNGARTRHAASQRTLRAVWAKPESFLDLEAPQPGANRCSLLELQQWHCRWPMGDPASENFGFCGCKPAGDLPYCPEHARMAYRPGARVARSVRI